MRRAALTLLLVACGDAPEVGGAGPHAPAPGGPLPGDPVPAELVALGYAEFDADADLALAGVRAHDAARAWDGVNLYTDERRRCLAVGMDGEVLHEWRLPYEGRGVKTFALVPDGGVVAMARNRGVFALDRDSTVRWSVPVNAHHEVAPRPDGGWIVPVWRLDPDFRGREVRFDGLQWISAAGEAERTWWTDDHLEALQALHPPLPLDLEPPGTPGEGTTYDYYHLNSVELLPASPLGEADPRFAAGNLLLCFRNASLLVVLDGADLSVTWSWGPGELDFPHMPRLVGGDRLLVYDNGYHRDWSRVLELDPRTGEVTWEYRADPPQAFWSQTRGSAQRLPNGNLLVCESDRGRAFEVTRDGALVWEYFNPEVTDEGRRRIYRMARVDRGRLPWLR